MTATKDEREAAKANKEVAEKFEAAWEQGYFGEVPDENPNSAYSLASGPDGVPLLPDGHTRFPQPEVKPASAGASEES